MKVGDCAIIKNTNLKVTIIALNVGGMCIVETSNGYFDVIHKDQLILTPKVAVKKEECL